MIKRKDISQYVKYCYENYIWFTINNININTFATKVVIIGTNKHSREYFIYNENRSCIILHIYETDIFEIDNKKSNRLNKKGYKIMRRDRMITRIVLQTTAEVMCIDVTTAEVNINTYTLGGTYTDTDLLKKLKEIYETDTYKLVYIKSNTHEEILLGMTESQFFKYATVVITYKERR